MHHGRMARKIITSKLLIFRDPAHFSISNQ